MRRALRHAIPSMFHRRLLLLLLAGAAVCLLLGAATARLTVGAEHATRLQRAKDALVTDKLIPTVRGRILDRHGRVLAIDEPAFALVVEYRVIAGNWAHDEAHTTARRRHWERWGELSGLERRALVAAELPPFEQQAEAFWQLVAEIGGLTREEVERRRAEVVRRVEQIAAGVTRETLRRLDVDLDEPITWSQAVTPVQEQTWKHAVLTDLTDDQRLAVQNFQAEARRQVEADRQEWLEQGSSYVGGSPMVVWLETDLLRPRQRRYPHETRTVSVETAHLPSPLRDQFKAQPVDVKVEGVALHLIGLMRPIWAEDEQRRPYRSRDEQTKALRFDYGGYLPGDHIGSFGVERSFEDVLRGTRGRERFHFDTGEREIIPQPQPGNDVHLSIDVQLQAHVQAIMSPKIGLMVKQPWHSSEEGHSSQVGEPLNGAAVVMDVATGDVLAAVSQPAMPLATIREHPKLIFDNHIDAPYRNRVVAQSYEPGSTIKPLVGVAAVTDGKLGAQEVVDVPGYLWERKPTLYRDWRFKRYMLPFGPLDLADALKVSSNVFFGYAAQSLGPERLMDWYRRFGLAQPTGSGLDGEVPGLVAKPEGGWEYLAIGESGVEWTPLQAATAYAALARGGSYLPPRLVMDFADGGGKRDLKLSRAGLSRVLEGMRRSANDREGTTHHLSLLEREAIFNIEGVTVMAKSGTAQAPPLREVAEYDEQGYPKVWGRVVREGDHAWVIALVQPQGKNQPTHVVAVVAEYAGSGGQVAGPVVNAIIHALKAEGYL